MSPHSLMIRNQKIAAAPLGKLVLRAVVAPLLLLCATSGIRAPFWQAPELKGPVESSECEEVAAVGVCSHACRRTVADPVHRSHSLAPTTTRSNTAHSAERAVSAGWLRNDLPAPLLC